jgi:predicted PurR-regulated permease PerM
MRYLDLSRHPLIAAAVLAVAAIGAVILVFVLVVVPLSRAAVQAPGQLAHAYAEYWNSVSQVEQQARQKYPVTP